MDRERVHFGSSNGQRVRVRQKMSLFVHRNGVVYSKDTHQYLAQKEVVYVSAYGQCSEDLKVIRMERVMAMEMGYIDWDGGCYWLRATDVI